MRDKWIETIANIRGIRDTTLFQALHWLARGMLKKEGYQWELHRTGELKIGYWRKILRTKNQRSAYPKRFVLVPGFGDTALSWYMVLGFLKPVLKQNFDELILIDLPGFGGFLSKERAFPSMSLLQAHVNDTFDYLKPHTILGHSLGGWLTGHYAAQCGLGVRPKSNKLNYSGPNTIILASASGVYADEASKQTMANLFRQSQTEGFKVLRPHIFLKEPAWFRLIAEHFEKFSTREDVSQFIDSVQEEHLLEKSASQIQSQVWLIWGEKDSLVPVSSVTAWLNHLNPALKDKHHAILIRNAGHSPQVEKAGVMAAILAQILSQKIPHRLGRRWWTIVNQGIQTLVILFLIGLSGVGYARSSSAAQESPADVLKGKKCEIWEDDQGIPHIFATEEKVGIACLGYVHGADRVWQMDFFKRIAQGRKAEIFGSNSIRSDFLMRLLNLPERGQKLYQQMGEDVKSWIANYTVGVNLGFQAALKRGVYEFQSLGYEPDNWTPEDTLTLILLQSFDQTQQSFQTQMSEQNRKDEASHSSTPSPISTEEKIPWDTTILKEGEYPRDLKKVYKAELDRPSLEKWADFPVFLGGIGEGSNNWVLSPKRSATGNAWLANDPHLKLTRPPFWKWVHLRAGKIDVIGATLPGIPLIVSGSNRHVSWGLTNSYLPVARLSYVPEKDLNDSKTVRPWIWFKFWKLKIPFFFKTFRLTKTDLPVLPLPSPPEKALVLRWSGFDLSSKDFAGFFELFQVKSAQDADLAFSRIGVPSWNFVFADDHGVIGYRAVGRIPRFEKDPENGIPSRTLTEVESSQEFASPLQSNEMPHVLNPRRGYVVTANNTQWPKDSLLSSGHAHSAAFRAFRIEELLLETEKHNLESIQKNQCDIQAVDARFILPQLVKVLESALNAYDKKDEARRVLEIKAIEKLKTWNFDADLECEACAIYRLWVKNLFEKDHSIGTSASLYRMSYSRSQEPKFNQDLYDSFSSALDGLGVIRQHPDQAFPKWGQLHLNPFFHLAGQEYFPAKPISTPGDEHSVNPGLSDWNGTYFQHTAGASQRMIVEMSSPPKVYSVLPGFNHDVSNRDLNERGTPWQRWVNCEQIRRHFPLERQEVTGTVIQVDF